MAPASYEELVHLLGDVDGLIVSRIQQTGASAREVSEAMRTDDPDLDLHDPDADGMPPSSVRVAQVRAILRDTLPPDLDDEDYVPATP